MGKSFLKKADEKTLAEIEKVGHKIAENNERTQRKMMEQESPFSLDITKVFSGYDEYRYILSLGLREAQVTRKSLIREIDLDLYVTEMKRTNFELMRQGLSPYTKDSKDCYIILHHIGQDFDAPFAELSAEEHAKFGNSKLLHTSKEESWRRDPQKEKAFTAEKAAYWKKRAANDIQILSDVKKASSGLSPYLDKQDVSFEIKRALEKLFSQCTNEDIRFIVGLAQTQLVATEIGATTIDEFAAIYRAEKGKRIECPNCGSDNVVLNGTYKTEHEQRQKYRCNDCGKVFSGLHNTLIQGSSFSIFQWLRFIDCLYNGYSIEKTAKLCGTNNTTASANRAILFFALQLLEEDVLLEGNVGIDETFFERSYKGNRDKQTNFKKDRPSRRRGSQSHTPGTSKDKVGVVCALDEYGASIAVVTGYGNATTQKLNNALRDHINPKCLKMLHSDKASAIKQFAKINGFPIQQCKSADVRSGKASLLDTARHIQRAESYNSRLKKFMMRFNGVSSDLLQGYASLFSWRERNRDRERYEAYRDLLGIMVTPTPYLSPLKYIEDLLEKIITDYPDNSRFFQNKQSEEKSKEIYDLYAKGVTVKEIAKRYHCSPQAITRRIRNLRNWGFAYKTPRDIAREEAMERKRTTDYRTSQKYIERGVYLQNLLAAKESWEGGLESFYVEMEAKHSLSKQSIKNDIATAKRVRELQEPFNIVGVYEYMDAEAVFTQISARYKELKQENPKQTKKELCKQLSKEFGYKDSTLYQIIPTSHKTTGDAQVGRKRRTPVTQTLNRDRSVFIDRLRWTGTNSLFLQWASQKYSVSAREIQEILILNYIADPRRYDMVEHD
jgi:transposase-like protein